MPPNRSSLRVTAFRVFLLWAGLLFSVDAAAKGGFTFLARLTSDYAYRGYTRSDNGPAFQGNIDYENDHGWFGGVWASSVDFTTMDFEHDLAESPEEEAAEGNSASASLEINPYVGFDTPLNSAWHLQGVVAGYVYNGQVLDTRYDYYEFYALLHYREQFVLRLGAAPDAYGYKQTGLNIDTQVRYPLSDVLELTGGIGFDSVSAVPGYAQLYWSLGVKWYLTAHIAVEARYYGAQPFAETPFAGGGAGPEPIMASPVQVSFILGF